MPCLSQIAVAFGISRPLSFNDQTKVYKDGVWHLLDQFQRPGNDLGEHAGNYYDLTPYISSDLRIMFETENQASMKDGDRVKFDNFNIFTWGDRAPRTAGMR